MLGDQIVRGYGLLGERRAHPGMAQQLLESELGSLLHEGCCELWESVSWETGFEMLMANS